MMVRHQISLGCVAMCILSCASDHDRDAGGAGASPIAVGGQSGKGSTVVGGDSSVGGAVSTTMSTAASIGGAGMPGSTVVLGTGGAAVPGTSSTAVPSTGGSAGAPGSSNTVVPIAGAAGASSGSVILSEVGKAELAQLQIAIAGTKQLNATTLAASHSTTKSVLGYAPLEAKYLDLINASPLALSTSETEVLASKGLVISDRQRFCSFYHGLDSIYAADLPVFISADAILEAVHRSYDAALRGLEITYLVSEVTKIITGMRDTLQATQGSDEQRADVDLYLAVALSLLKGSAVAPVAGADATKVTEFVKAAQAALGMSNATLFGQDQSIDWSQFAPRGHYTETAVLQQYFRAMIWLGRTPMRLVATDSFGNQKLMRRQFDTALLMTEVLGESGLAKWKNVEQVLSAFVGENDNLTPAELPKLFADLGVTKRTETAAIDDATLLKTILVGGYGSQRIVSQIMYNGIDKTLPSERAFLLFGQRYVVDSHVFSNVVYDRAGGGAIRRMMPSTLDVAYAALGNDDALPLLSSELQTYAYAPDLEAMRILVDSHGDDYWKGSLYTRWLSALRALSPVTGLNPTGAATLPAIAKTEPWGRRVLNSQLGSWAELRHDTLLYAKQSYTGYPSCEYPDAYVDPYPEFFARVASLAERGIEVASLVSSVTGTAQTSLATYFTKLSATANMLRDMATEELTGAAFTQAQIDFINRAVRFKEVDMICTKVVTPTGWYVDLFLNPDDISKCQPTIADVHTQPADEAGNEVGRILHVGTGYPRMMVTTMDTCTGPKAYVGIVFAYHERITEQWKRLTDQVWTTEVASKSPADVTWMTDLIAH